MPQLISRSEEFPNLTFTLTQNIHTIGRLEDNDIFIPHPSLSGHHAELSTNGQDYTLTDLGSTNGTYINDERIEKIQLRSGNIVRFGNIEFIYQSEFIAEGIPLPEPTPFPDLTQSKYRPPSEDYKNLAKNPKPQSKSPPWLIIHSIIILALITAIIYFFIAIFQNTP
jgi:pSer/pThr/pTyr-binding forkhead associated (FHA) protein